MYILISLQELLRSKIKNKTRLIKKLHIFYTIIFDQNRFKILFRQYFIKKRLLIRSHHLSLCFSNTVLFAFKV